MYTIPNPLRAAWTILCILGFCYYFASISFFFFSFETITDFQFSFETNIPDISLCVHLMETLPRGDEFAWNSKDTRRLEEIYKLPTKYIINQSLATFQMRHGLNITLN